MKGFLQARWFEPKMLAAVQALQPLAAEAGLSIAQFALAWVLRQPNVAAAIIGASRPEQVDENVAASGHPLPADLIARAEEIIGRAA
jgi:aryl-alcohol dehydrogenase-like predicted oxidoreductase